MPHECAGHGGWRKAHALQLAIAPAELHHLHVSQEDLS